MKSEQLKSIWKQAENEEFSGWDFSYMEGKSKDDPLPWEYKSIVLTYLQPEYKLLDMDTGGGEFLLSLQHPYDKTTVTESWEPNIKICMQRLSPKGITVCPTEEGLPIPLDDQGFDIIINRHGSYDVNEVYRMLKPEGIFVTQQVGSENDKIFAERLNDAGHNYLDTFSLSTEVPKFESAGFELLYSNEIVNKTRHFDVSGIVFHAKRISWCYPDFSVEKDFDKLYKMHEEILEKGFIENSQHRFIIAVKKH